MKADYIVAIDSRAVVSGRITRVLLASGLVEIATAITLATGLLLINSGSALDYNFNDYGFPFAWKEGVSGYGIGSTSLSWFLFLLDVLFFMAVGYIVLGVVKKWRLGSTSRASPTFLLSAGYVVTAVAMFALIAWT